MIYGGTNYSSLKHHHIIMVYLTPDCFVSYSRHGVKQKNFEVLCVSQFTLYGTLSKKNQPDYKLAMKAIPAEALYVQFLQMLRESYEDDKVFDGKFGAMMDVELINDGPVTLVIDSEPKAKGDDGEEKKKS